METKTFLKRVLGDDGFYCVCAFSDERRIQKLYPSIDAVVDASKDLDEQGFDIYFGLSTFETGQSRKADNVKNIRSFFLDLDCGPSKEYPTQKDALTDLIRFCKTLSLPKPVMVSSGNGVHVYWLLSESVIVDDWLPVATRLKKLCVEHKLLADPVVTADVARILRVPNTHNYKNGVAKDVSFIGIPTNDLVDFDQFSELLGGDSIPVPKTMTPNSVASMRRENSDTEFKIILSKTVKGNGCEQIKNIIQNRENLSEPMWRAGLSIAKACTDSGKAIDLMSKGHAGYDEKLTEEKVAGIKGPYSCERFEEYNPNGCTNCKHKGKITNPLALGHVIKQAPSVPDIPDYPAPYFRGANGGIYVRVRDADGEEEHRQIYHNDLYVVRRIRDVELGEAIVMRLHLPKDGVREFTVPLTAVTSKEELRKQLSMQGIAVARMDELMQYTTTWVNELQSQSEADEAHRQFGWSNDECKSFILGNQEIFKDRVDFNPPSSQTVGLFPSFEPKGSLEKWKETLNFYNRDNFELHQFVVGTSFGSPLMQFLPINCAGLHIHSKESGVGKTTAMFAGVSVWGDPEDLVLQEEDTYNTKMNRGELYHNLPLYIDELTNTSGKELSNLAYQLTGGRQRGRMSANSNTERARGNAWKLLAVTTGNTSIVERISMTKAMPKAEAQRILECRVSRIHFDTKGETDKFSADIKNNYGHAGKVYIQYIMSNLDAVITLLGEVQEAVDRKAHLTAENRYWSVLATTTIVGLIMAKRAGLIQYDTSKVFSWIIERLKENKRQVADMSISVEETLNDYIHEHWSNVLWIKSTDDLRKQDGDVTSLVIPEALPRGKLVARYETDLKRVYLIPKPLKAWCGEQQINYNSFIHDLKTKLGATSTKMRLSKGTHMNLPVTHVVAVDCSIENENKTGNTEVK